MTSVLITGGSRGLGAALAAGLPVEGDTVYVVSRSRPQPDRQDGVARIWIEADLALSGASRRVSEVLGDARLDVLICNAGIWEAGAFGDAYDFEKGSEEEIRSILAVNLTSAITFARAVIPNLRRSDRGKIILIGSTSGLENTRSPEVAYSASKFGLRGVAHALREVLRKERIAVTCINPGEVAAEIPYERGAEEAISAYGGARIPVQDLVAIVRCLMSLSGAICVKEIDAPALMDRNA